jgi:hypothetical protein
MQIRADVVALWFGYTFESCDLEHGSDAETDDTVVLVGSITLSDVSEEEAHDKLCAVFGPDLRVESFWKCMDFVDWDATFDSGE